MDGRTDAIRVTNAGSRASDDWGEGRTGTVGGWGVGVNVL